MTHKKRKDVWDLQCWARGQGQLWLLCKPETTEAKNSDLASLQASFLPAALLSHSGATTKNSCWSTATKFGQTPQLKSGDSHEHVCRQCNKFTASLIIKERSEEESIFFKHSSSRSQHREIQFVLHSFLFTGEGQMNQNLENCGEANLDAQHFISLLVMLVRKQKKEEKKNENERRK